MKTNDFVKMLKNDGAAVYLDIALATILVSLSDSEIEESIKKTMLVMESKGLTEEQAKNVCSSFVKSIKPLRNQLPKIQ